MLTEQGTGTIKQEMTERSRQKRRLETHGGNRKHCTPCSFIFLSEYLCHVYVRNDNLGAVVIADTEYPQRVCFTLLDKVGNKPDLLYLDTYDRI